MRTPHAPGHRAPQARVPRSRAGGLGGGYPGVRPDFRALPADFRAAVAVVQHRPPQEPGFLAVVLNRCSTLPVQDAATGDRLQPGRIPLLPPITTWSSNRMGACRSPRRPRARGAPAADILFASVDPV